MCNTKRFVGLCYGPVAVCMAVVACCKLPTAAKERCIVPHRIACCLSSLSMHVAIRGEGCGRSLQDSKGAEWLLHPEGPTTAQGYLNKRARVPDQGATVPVAYATAYDALVVRGRLRANHRVLIHSATGAVGLAATRIALNRGCEVRVCGAPASFEGSRDHELAVLGPACSASCGALGSWMFGVLASEPHRR